jgi:hypothetical protein
MSHPLLALTDCLTLRGKVVTQQPSLLHWKFLPPNNSPRIRAAAFIIKEPPLSNNELARGPCADKCLLLWSMLPAGTARTRWQAMLRSCNLPRPVKPVL